MYKRHVVVVEDEAFLRSLLAEYLEKAGFIVTTAATAADARRAIKSVDPDAVVLDIDLGPGPNGLDIGEALLAHSADIAVVYLTSLSDVRFVDESVRTINPRAAYLNKTRINDNNVLVEALESVLQDKGVTAYRHDKDADRPLADLSLTQIQILKLIAEGMTNQQIADVRKRSLSATEGTISRAFQALGVEPSMDGNARVLAARKFLTQSGLIYNR
jgi:DNA-binding NarL/FixJ family response regulator